MKVFLYSQRVAFFKTKEKAVAFFLEFGQTRPSENSRLQGIPKSSRFFETLAGSSWRFNLILSLGNGFGGAECD